MDDASLLTRRGDLLSLARKKVAEEGYQFKKGHSRSKVYGQSDQSDCESAPKRKKYDQEMRENRLKVIEEELGDISRMLVFKEKRLSQAESSRNYKSCEQLTEEVMALKSKRRELNAEKKLFEMKVQRSKRRMAKKQDSESSDMDGCKQCVSRKPFFRRTSSTSSCKSTTPSEGTPDPTDALPPSCIGSRINPIECDTLDDFSSCSSPPQSPTMPSF